MARKMKNSGIPWIGEIPVEWWRYKLKYAFYRKKAKANKENPVVLRLARSGIQIRDINNNEGQIAESYYEYNPVAIGDLLINPMDLYSGANCNLSFLEGVISPAYINLRAKENIYAKYYDYYFKTQYWSMALFAHGKGVSFDNRWTLNNDTLMNYYIPHVIYDEQKAIAKYLDEKCSQIDRIIEKSKEVIEEYKKFKQALITEIVTQGLDKNAPMKESCVEWIGEIPAHWSIIKLRYLGTLQNGISISGDKFGSGYPFVSYGDVYNNQVLPVAVKGQVQSSEKDRNNYDVKENDVFFTRTSETIEEIGMVSTCLTDIENATFAGFLIRFRPTTDLLNKNYSKYYFFSNVHRRFFVKEMNLVTRASLSQDLLKRLPVLLPTLEEQQEIADFLDIKCNEIDNIISQKEQLINELDTYKKSLIYECVTGKSEVM